MKYSINSRSRLTTREDAHRIHRHATSKGFTASFTTDRLGTYHVELVDIKNGSLVTATLHPAANCADGSYIRSLCEWRAMDSIAQDSWDRALLLVGGYFV